MVGKFGRVAVSALALMASFGALDAVTVGKGAAQAQVLTAAQVANPPASVADAAALLVSLINQATSNGTDTTNGAGVTDAVILLMSTFANNPAAVGYITAALVQAASGDLAELSSPAFAGIGGPILTGVQTVVNAWAQGDGSSFNPSAFDAFRIQVSAMEGSAALGDFQNLVVSAEKLLPKVNKDEVVSSEDGDPPGSGEVLQSNPLTRVGPPSPTAPVSSFVPGGAVLFAPGSFSPGDVVTFTVTGETGGASLQ